MLSIFNAADQANKKIQNVISQFNGMIIDLNDGIQTLGNEITKNTAVIEQLTTTNSSHDASIKAAESLRNNIENLLK